MKRRASAQRGRRPGGRGARGARLRDYQSAARQRLKRFRKASLLAVALAGMLLLIWSGDSGLDAAAGAPAQEVVAEESAAESAPLDAGESVEQARGTIRELIVGAWSMAPKVLIALFILLLAAGLARATRFVIERSLRSWSRAEAVSALTAIVIFLVALGAALSVIAGDARALVGSVGLAGLALSWALQAPIESFTGWLLNSFRGYYRVGDRIAVGEVFGDVYEIDILTTTVWEAGGPDKPVQGAQPTGALITFPNSDVLRANIINYTRDFPFVWDEVAFAVANESDLAYASSVIERVAQEIVGKGMDAPIGEYRRLLQRRRLDFDVGGKPTVFASLANEWTNLTVRYLVPARERRRWASDLVIAVSIELAKPEHQSRIISAYPHTEIELIEPRPARRPFQAG